MWNPPCEFKKYMTPERDVLCAVGFEVKSPDLTNAQKIQIVANSIRYYVNDPALLDSFKSSLIRGMYSVLTLKEYSQTSATDRRFLRGFIPDNDSVMFAIDADPCEEVFRALKAHYGEDSKFELAEFRKTLDSALEPYYDKGVVKRFAADPKKDVDVDKNAVKIRVYKVNEDPEKAKEVGTGEVLFGRGEKIDGALQERINDPRFAALLAAKIKRDIPETIKYDYQESKKECERELERVSEQSLPFEKGDTLVEAGDTIGDQELRLLNAERLERLSQRPFRAKLSRFFASFVLLSMFMIGGFVLFYHNIVATKTRRRKVSINDYAIFLTMMIVTVGFGKFLQFFLHNGGASPELVPVLIFVQLLALSATWEIAFTVGVVLAFLLNFTSPNGLGGFAVFLGCSLIASLVSRSVQTRSQLFVVALSVAVTGFTLSFVIDSINGNYAHVVQDAGVRGIWGFFAGFLTAGVLPVFERVFGVLTPMRLLEYSNPSHPLLLELNQRAPATYSHSIQTAALAEPAAEAIGARSSLVRVGAYFHDVGKMLQPQNFTENQKDVNPHDTLEPRVSVLIIVAHTKDGVDLGKKYRLPRQVVDLIAQHHGTMFVGRFYDKANAAAKAKDPDAPPLDEAPYRHQGPLPQTKEAGVLMLADAVESASRSLSDWSPRRVENLVQKIADARIEDGQFNESGLTLGEIHTIKQSLISTLLASHHTRVKYADKKAPEKNGEQKESANFKDANAPNEQSEAKEQKVSKESGAKEQKVQKEAPAGKTSVPEEEPAREWSSNSGIYSDSTILFGKNGFKDASEK